MMKTPFYLAFLLLALTSVAASEAQRPEGLGVEEYESSEYSLAKNWTVRCSTGD